MAGSRPATAVVISLTTFISYAAATGRGKTAVVARAKARYGEQYAKEKDFWLPLRHAIMAAHERGRKLSTLDDLLQGVSAAKIASYTEAIGGYQKWAGKVSPFAGHVVDPGRPAATRQPARVRQRHSGQ